MTRATPTPAATPAAGTTVGCPLVRTPLTVMRTAIDVTGLEVSVLLPGDAGG